MSCSHLGLLFSGSCLYDSYPEILPVLLPEIHKRKALRKPSKDQELDAGKQSKEQEIDAGKPTDTTIDPREQSIQQTIEWPGNG